jgi:ATP-dependent DNA helicase RecG
MFILQLKSCKQIFRMLTAEDIKSIIASGEGYNAEFKVRLPSKVKELASEICAFANAAGGVLLIGVDNNNTIHGVNIVNDKRSAIQDSLNEINPHLPNSFYSVNIEGKDVWVIEVSSGSQKPYTMSGAIYVRQGPNSQKITSVEQMRDFFQQSDRIYFDEGACPDFNITKDIDSSFFEEFRISAGLSSAISREQIINNLKLTFSDAILKNGGVLFFGSAPEQIFDKAVIRCVAFEGLNKTQIIDDKVFGGPLMRQFQHAMQWLKTKLNVRYEIKGSGPRIEIWEIPETAFKEALINALSHRDYYDKGARITVELFSDRVEITNPGGLVSAISPAEFGKKSHSRNPLLFGLFERVDMVEQIGSGIGRIKDEIAKAGLPVPQFTMDGMFTVVFQRQINKPSEKNANSNLSKVSEKIIELIATNKFITIPALAEKTGVTTRTIERNIKKLQSENRIIRVGVDKTGYWSII